MTTAESNQATVRNAKKRSAFVACAAIAMSACEGTAIRALEAGPCASGSPTALMAMPAAGFVQTIGINVRLTHDGPYQDTGRVEARLRELGAPHVIDEVGSSGPRLRELARQGLRIHATYDAVDDLAHVARETAGILAGLHVGAAMPPGTVDEGAFLRRHVEATATNKRAIAALASAPLIGPSLGGDLDHASAMARALGDASAWVDLGAFSPPMGFPWNDATAAAARVQASVLPPGGKLVAPQAGFSTATSGGVSKAVQAKYVLRTAFGYAARGIVRTFITQLVDESADGTSFGGNYGLLTSDFERKPAFVALRNAIEVAKASAPATAPRRLDVVVDGAPASLQSLLLDRGGGVFSWAHWLEERSGDTSMEAPITVRLPPGARSLATSRPHVSTAATPLPSAGTVTVTARDEVQLLSFEVACGP